VWFWFPKGESREATGAQNVSPFVVAGTVFHQLPVIIL